MNLPPSILRRARTTLPRVSTEPAQLAVAFTLPWPPSVNRIWRHRKGGGVYSSPEARDYRQSAARAALAAGVRPFTGAVSVTLDLYPPARRGDCDNFSKAVQDSLNGIAWKDDRQVSHLEVTRHEPDKANPRVEVVIRSLTKGA